MPISSLNWQAVHAWLLAHEGYWVLGTVVLFVVVVDVRRAVIGDVPGADVQLAVEEGAKFTQLVQDDEDRRALCLCIGDD